MKKQELMLFLLCLHSENVLARVGLLGVELEFSGGFL